MELGESTWDKNGDFPSFRSVNLRSGGRRRRRWGVRSKSRHGNADGSADEEPQIKDRRDTRIIIQLSLIFCMYDHAVDRVLIGACLKFNQACTQYIIHRSNYEMLRYTSDPAFLYSVAWTILNNRHIEIRWTVP